jgi:hypothetical protein
MDLFAVYAREQNEFVETIVNDLTIRWSNTTSSSLSIYLYKAGFFAGTKDLEVQETWVRSSRGVIIFVSPESVVSESIATLVSVAAQIGKPRLPVITEHPRSDRSYRMFDYSNAIDLSDNYSLGLEQILAVFETWQ